MAFKEVVKIKELDIELHKKCTGNAKTLARRIGVSRSTLYNLFEELEEIGAEIGLDPQKNTYYYIKEVKIVFSVELESNNILTVSDLKKIFGGTKNNCFNPRFWTVPQLL
jgi:DNA-binding Lrp family transcriptional regulator